MLASVNFIECGDQVYSVHENQCAVIWCQPEFTNFVTFLVIPCARSLRGNMGN